MHLTARTPPCCSLEGPFPCGLSAWLILVAFWYIEAWLEFIDSSMQHDVRCSMDTTWTWIPMTPCFWQTGQVEACIAAIDAIFSELQTNHGPTLMHLGLMPGKCPLRRGVGSLWQSLFHILSRPILAHSHARTNRMDCLSHLCPRSFSSLCAASCWDLAGVLKEEAWRGCGIKPYQ